MISVRTINPNGDIPQLIRLAQAVGSEPITGGMNVTPEQQPADYVVRRAVADMGDGTLRGFSWIARAPWRPEGWFEVQIVVDPAYRRQRIGTALFDEAMQFLGQHGATLLQTQIRDNDPAALQFAQRCGFEHFQHFFTMVLDVTTVDETQLARAIARPKAAGFQFFTFADVAHMPEARHKLYELNRRLAPDLPGNDDSFPSFDEYVHEIIESGWFRPEGQFIAADRTHWVGLAGMGFDDDTTIMRHEFTAVDRSYRGKGIAQALKSQSILLARKLGIREILTGNDASNTAILAVNRKLGYRQQPGLYKLHRQLP